MATSFKTLLGSDVQNNATKLHEAIPITGTIISGTYNDSTANNLNIKNYVHGMFQSVYDYPYLSSSANHIFDITAGFSGTSVLSGAATVQNEQKIQIYQQMAQVLCGHNANGEILPFDVSGNFSIPPQNSGKDAASKMDSVLFLNFARLLNKDEMQKGTFQLNLGVSPSASIAAIAGKSAREQILVQDVSGSDNYKVNSPAGEYNILYVTSSGPSGCINKTLVNQPCGLIFYQAGIAVLTSSLFKINNPTNNNRGFLDAAVSRSVGWPNGLLFEAPNSARNKNIEQVMTGSFISSSADGLRNRIQNISFANTTELNSTIYFCRANSNEFNFSSNPTYLKESKMRVKEVQADQPVSYITTVGLYGASNEMLAVAKLSEPLKKTPANEFTLRVRLDY